MRTHNWCVRTAAPSRAMMLADSAHTTPQPRAVRALAPDDRLAT